MNKRLMYDDEFEAWTRFACAALTAAVADPRLATDTNVIEAAAHYADRMMTQWQTRRPYPESPYAAEVTKGDPTQ